MNKSKLLNVILLVALVVMASVYSVTALGIGSIGVSVSSVTTQVSTTLSGVVNVNTTVQLPVQTTTTVVIPTVNILVFNLFDVNSQTTFNCNPSCNPTVKPNDNFTLILKVVAITPAHYDIKSNSLFMVFPEKTGSLAIGLDSILIKGNFASIIPVTFFAFQPTIVFTP